MAPQAAARVMLGSFPLNQLEQTPEICLMSSLHFVRSLRIMALTVFNRQVAVV